MKTGRVRDFRRAGGPTKDRMRGEGEGEAENEEGDGKGWMERGLRGKEIKADFRRKIKNAGKKAFGQNLQKNSPAGQLRASFTGAVPVASSSRLTGRAAVRAAPSRRQKE